MAKIDFFKEYTTVKNPSSFGGVQSFYKHLKSKYKNVKLKDVKEWLQSQDIYTYHKPRSRYFSRNRVYAEKIDSNWQMDLCDMRNISTVNSGYKYILTIIDVFSKFAWAIPIKNKSADTVLTALKSVLDFRKPKKIQADEGLEFFNKNCKEYMLKHNINMFFTKSELKACVVERFNRTLKEKIWKYFTLNKLNRYIDVLKDIVDSYNNTYHRSIKFKPVQVNKSNEDQVFINLYGFNKKIDKQEFSKQTLQKPNFKINDTVRISKYKPLFEKGYTRRWTEEIFIIKKVLFNDLVTYELEDLEGKILEGRYYEKELQKVIFTDSKIHYKRDLNLIKIIKSRKLKGKTQHLVHFKNYPDTSDKWINSEELE